MESLLLQWLLPSRPFGRASPSLKEAVTCLVAALFATAWSEASDAFLALVTHGNPALHFGVLSTATFILNTCSSLTGAKAKGE